MYGSEWYKLPPKNIKPLFLVMHRAQKPLELTAGKFCSFSLELYCSVSFQNFHIFKSWV